MNKSDELKVKFNIICVSDNCSGGEEWTGLLSECPEDYINGLTMCIDRAGGGSHFADEDCLDTNSHDEDCLCGHESCDPMYTASLFTGTLHDLRVAESSGSHSSHSLSDNCKEKCLGDYI